MNKFDYITKDKLVIVMLAYSLIVYAIGILVGGATLWTIGIILGTALAIFKLKSMEMSLTKAVNLPEHKATQYSLRQYVIRYTITGVVLLISAFIGIECLFGVFFGLMGMKVGAYSQIFITHK